MSVNKHKPHVLVLPEDDANRQIAEGFTLDPSIHDRNIQILPVAGGWTAVRDAFIAVHQSRMLSNPWTWMVLLVDFDGRGEERWNAVTSCVEQSLRHRVFVLGAHGEPEALRAALGSYETIGKALARECKDGTGATWGHALLAHNRTELDRMMPLIRPILFG